MLFDNYRIISLACFIAGALLLLYAILFAWKNHLSSMYRDVKKIEENMSVEQAGKEVFSSIRAEDLRRYREAADDPDEGTYEEEYEDEIAQLETENKIETENKMETENEMEVTEFLGDTGENTVLHAE